MGIAAGVRGVQKQLNNQESHGLGMKLGEAQLRKYAREEEKYQKGLMDQEQVGMGLNYLMGGDDNSFSPSGGNSSNSESPALAGPAIGLPGAKVPGVSPVKPDGVSGASWAKAMGQYSTYMGDRDAIQKHKFNEDVRFASDTFAKQLSENGGDFDRLTPRTSAEIAAQAALVDSYKGTEAGKVQIQENRSKLLTKKYNEFVAGRNQASHLLNEKNYDQAANGIIQMSRSAPLPYSFGDYNPEDGTFAVNYLSSKTGNTPTGQRMSFAQAWNKIVNVNDEQYFTQGAMNAEAISQGNAATRSDPSQHLHMTRGEDSFIAIPQKNAEDTKELYYDIYPTGGGKKITVRSKDELYRQGFKFEDLEREGKKASIAHTQEATATAKANRTNNPKALYVNVPNIGRMKRSVAIDEMNNLAKQFVTKVNSNSPLANLIGSTMALSEDATPEEKKAVMQKAMQNSDMKAVAAQMSALENGHNPTTAALARQYRSFLQAVYLPQRFESAQGGSSGYGPILDSAVAGMNGTPAPSQSFHHYLPQR